MGTEELARRLWEYAEFYYEDEGSIEENVEAIKKQISDSPEAVIEYLLDCLDSFTMEV